MQHPILGSINLTVTRRQRMVNVVIRWTSADALRISAPIHATDADIIRALDKLAPRLLKRRPQPNRGYTENQSIILPDLTIRLTRQHHRPDKILIRAGVPESTLALGDNIPVTSAALINRAVIVVLNSVAPDILIPRARQIAGILGLSPDGWKISKSRRTLGTCSASGIISLSCHLLLLPRHLRDYVIAHELTHLICFDHSPAFHSQLNRHLRLLLAAHGTDFAEPWPGIDPAQDPEPQLRNQLRKHSRPIPD